MDYFPFQEGVCPVCLEVGGEQLPFFQAKVHDICMQDWIWLRPSNRCPCCNQGLPRPYLQMVVVARFQRVEEMRTNMIAVSNRLINLTFIKFVKQD